MDVKGIIETYQVNADGTETVLERIDRSNYTKPYNHGFGALRSDILTRFVFVDLHPPAPDFWITSPNGTSFTGEPGSTITIPTEVWNSGNKKDTTDFISWWDGESWDNKVAKYDNLTLGYGEKADTPVTVTVPAAAKTLWFRCNVDNNTPAGESDLTNNALAVAVGPNNADVGVSISVDTTRPKRNSRVSATVNATNHGPAIADVRLVIGENNGADQVVNHYDEDVFIFTLAPGSSKRLTYKSSGYPAGHSTYFATKAEVTNTTDPNLSNNFCQNATDYMASPCTATGGAIVRH